MNYPKILINAEKIRENTEYTVGVCRARGIEVIGVTKACLGDPVVANAMLDGGAAGLGDSRLANIARLRNAGIDSPIMLLRLPMLSEAARTVEMTDTSLDSDVNIIESLGKAAQRIARDHKIILMVDMGDGREGLEPGALVETSKRVAELKGIELVGIGMNVACLAGSKPTTDQMRRLAEMAVVCARATGTNMPVVSAGNSSAWDLVANGSAPAGVNQVRFGELILLGRETAGGKLVPGMASDAFVIEAEIIESIPERGSHHIAAIGRQDIDAASLKPVDDAWQVVKASSDHLVLKKNGRPSTAGAAVSFIPGYESLLRAMTSPFVAKEYV